jgi:hypothetical protein
MHVQPRRRLTDNARRLFGAALAASLIAAMAAIPTASASPTASPQTIPGASVPALSLPVGDLGGLETILKTLPVTDLGLNSSQLEKVVKELNPGILGGLLGQVSTLVTNLLGNPQATLGDLLTETNTLLGLGHSTTLDQLLEKLTPTQLTALLGGMLGTGGALTGLGGLSDLLSGLTGKLNVGDLESLQGVFGGLLGNLPGSGLTTLETDLQTLLAGLSTGELTAILTPLKGVLSGTGLTQLEALLSELGKGSISPTKLQELLSGLDASELSALLGGVFGTVSNPSLLQTVVDDLLGGIGSITPTNAGSLAGELGISVETLAKDLGTTAADLPATVTTVLGKEGPLLGLLGTDGITLSLLGSGGKDTSTETAKEKEATEAKESKEAKERSEAGAGGNGSPGSNGAAGGSTVVVNLPAAAVPAVPLVATPNKAAAKIKILSHKVKGHIATLVLQIPAAGKVTVSGGGVRAIGKGATKAERLTVRIPLSKAGTASLRQHRNRLSVALKASFKPTSGASSSAGVTVHFA